MGWFDDAAKFVSDPMNIIDPLGASNVITGRNGGLTGMAGQALNGITGQNNTNDALASQAAATEKANQIAKDVYGEQTQLNQPWMNAGTGALSSLQDPKFQQNFSMQNFQQDPGYQFRLSEGNKAIERAAGARGLNNSGATLKALSRYGQDYASGEYEKSYGRFNADQERNFGRLSSIANLGQNATNSQINSAGNYGNRVGENTIGLGNAQAAANIAQGNRNSQLTGQLIGAGAAFFSDERLKKDITPISKADLDEMKKELKAYSFKYIDEALGKGEHIGVMAQDLEKSKLGKSLVSEDKNGFKFLDIKKVMSLFLATLAEG
jgi:hypothetical protein